ncbi:hypothetical protein N657DRAFT_13952 [Parathielavia appendiculata]|uniref:Uncharacterized protein n=1 Tax=Parathielavia appendiculata TaxID=2587402 RepID=A0AAN6U8Z4_9PEZI|nr:hypothetical protein N657DRAFT_13952 [Parathielavia appendiculata]
MFSCLGFVSFFLSYPLDHHLLSFFPSRIIMATAQGHYRHAGRCFGRMCFWRAYSGDVAFAWACCARHFNVALLAGIPGSPISGPPEETALGILALYCCIMRACWEGDCGTDIGERKNGRAGRSQRVWEPPVIPGRRDGSWLEIVYISVLVSGPGVMTV